MNTCITIRADEFYSISYKELEKFFGSIEKKAVDLHKAAKEIKQFKSDYEKNPLIRFKGIFAFHPYFAKQPWLLYKRQASLCCKDNSKIYDQYFESTQAWYSYYNGNIKNDPRVIFDHLEVMPRIEIQVLVTVTEDQIKDSLFETKDKTRYFCRINELTAEIKLGDCLKSNTLLKNIGKDYPVFDRSHLQIYFDIVNWHTLNNRYDTLVTGEKVYIYDDIRAIEHFPIECWNTINIDKVIKEMISKHIELKAISEVGE